MTSSRYLIASSKRSNQYFIDSQSLFFRFPLFFCRVSHTMTNLKDDLQEKNIPGSFNEWSVTTYSCNAKPNLSNFMYSLHDICSSTLMRVQNQFNNTNEYISVQKKVECNDKTSKSRISLIRLDLHHITSFVETMVVMTCLTVINFVWRLY